MIGLTQVALQVRGAVPATPIELVTSATTVTQVVLAILAALSLLSWAIMLGAGSALGRARRATDAFRREFDQAHRLDEAAGTARRGKATVMSRMVERAVQFVANAKVAQQQAREADPRVQAGLAVPDRALRLTVAQIETLHLVLDSEAQTERERLSKYLPLLAIIGSVSPLIGLLGTVLGVIEAFIGIATKGSGNLSAIAPGVAEALIATAAALTVAIPATFGYNILANRLNRLDARLETFATSIIALLAREGHV